MTQPSSVPKPANAGTGIDAILNVPAAGVNLRMAPRTSAIRITALTNKTPVVWYRGGSVSADGYTWYWVEVKGKTYAGWMALLAATPEAQFVPTQTPPPVVEKTIQVPYYSQLTSPGAELDSADCGETSARMLIGWLLKSKGLPDFPGLTIDDLTRAIGKQHNAYLQLEQLKQLLTMYGFTNAQVVRGPMTLDRIAQEIDAGRPAIPLVRYAYIYPGDSFTAGHFLVSVGYSSTHIIVHDPYRGGANYHIARAQFEQALTQWGNPPMNPSHAGILIA